MKIMTVVGARPNFMKAAPIVAALRDRAGSGDGSWTGGHLQHFLLHTGQHYDPMMSGSFFADLGLPQPDESLNAGSGSHASQTAEIMKRFEAVVLREKPEVLVLVGDVNSTLACALVAAKISFDANSSRPLIAHVEAGLRSFDRTMPEEINRILTDHVSDLLFVTEPSALRNLALEGIPPERIHFVGNTMIDSLLRSKEKADSSPILDELSLRTRDGGLVCVLPYALLTLHRPANVDRRSAFVNILEGLEELAGECSIVFPSHPRTEKRIREFGLGRYFESNGNGSCGSAERALPSAIRMIPPLGYLDFLCLMKNAAMVITDSGGVQEETTCLGIPCVTVRDNTERPVTVEKGTNVIAGTTRESIAAAVRAQAKAKVKGDMPEKWDGQAALRIVEILVGACLGRASFAAHPGPQPRASAFCEQPL